MRGGHDPGSDGPAHEQGAPGNAEAVSAATAAGGAPPPPQRPPPRPIVERDAELAELAGRLADAREGRGGLLLIEGPPGIGKTRLLGAAREVAGDLGLATLGGRASELERDLPFGVIRQLFERRLHREAAGDRESLLEGSAGLARPLLVADENRFQGADSSTLRHGLYWLTSNLADREPLLLTVDDAHWADAASLSFLHYLGRRLDDLRVLLAITMRPADPEAHDEIASRIRSGPLAAVIRLAPLSADGVARLVRDRLQADAAQQFCAACHTATGGNPFLLEELLEELEADRTEPDAAHADAVAQLVPDSVGRHVLARLARLSAEAVALARSVATFGGEVELELAARLADLEPGSAGEAAEALARAELLAAGPVVAFVHPLIQEAVNADVPAGARSEAHGRAAQLLEEVDAPNHRIAAQWHLTHPAGEPRAVAALREAAVDALARGDPDSAVSHLRRAVSEPPNAERRPDVLRELGAAELQTLSPACIEHLRAALDLSADPRNRAAIAAQLSLALIYLGRQLDAVELLRGELELAADGDIDLRLELEAELAITAVWGLDGSPDDIDRRLEVLRDSITPHSAGGRGLIAARAMRKVQRGEDAEAAAALAADALRSGLLDDGGPGSPRFVTAAAALLLSGAHDALREWAHVGLGQAQAAGDVKGVSFCTNLIASSALQQGAIADAEAMAADSLRLARDHEMEVAIPPALAGMVSVLVARGDSGRAWRELHDDGLEQDRPPQATAMPFLEARGRLYALDGEHEAALIELRSCGDRVERWGASGKGLWNWRPPAVDSLLALGRHGEARELAAEDLAAALRFGAPRPIGLAQRAVALSGPAGERAEALAEAAATLDRAGDRLEQARALCDRGAQLRRMGHRADAREDLRRARELAHRCGSTPLEERARQELLAAGARPRRIATSGAEALTPSERRVAMVAASGRSNREIAQSLFVSRKTVEMHLTRAFAKLEIGSRSELPGALDLEAPGGQDASEGKVQG